MCVCVWFFSSEARSRCGWLLCCCCCGGCKSASCSYRFVRSSQASGCVCVVCALFFDRALRHFALRLFQAVRIGVHSLGILGGYLERADGSRGRRRVRAARHLQHGVLAQVGLDLHQPIDLAHALAAVEAADAHEVDLIAHALPHTHTHTHTHTHMRSSVVISK